MKPDMLQVVRRIARLSAHAGYVLARPGGKRTDTRCAYFKICALCRARNALRRYEARK